MTIYFNKEKFILLFALLGGLLGSVRAHSLTNESKEDINMAVDSLPLTGVVEDASTGLPISGLNITIENYSASITEDDGTFSTKVPSYHAVVHISGQEYQNKYVALKGRRHIEVKLNKEPFHSVYDNALLPFGEKPESHIMYAIGTLNSAHYLSNDEQKWGRSTKETPGSYLQGAIAGLNAVRLSGTPGTGSNLSIRGFNSMLANNQPLIVVDGVIYDNNEYGSSIIDGQHYNPLSDIDVKDIENITVLKSGTSTYGTRGANGVILITTERAKELSTKIDLAVYGGYNDKGRRLPMMNAADYRIYLTDLFQSGGFSHDSIAELPYMNDLKNMKKNPDYYRYHYNTDWQKQVLNHSYNQNVYLKVTGGDNIAAYALSVGYLKNEGIIKNTDMTRLQSRFNGDLNLSNRLKASINVSFTSNQRKLQKQGLKSQVNPLYLGLIKSPFLPVNAVDDSGLVSPNLAGVDDFNNSNPVALIRNMQGDHRNYRFRGTVKFKYDFNDKFSLQTLLGLTFDKVQEEMFIPQTGVVADTLSTAIAYNRTGANVERFFSLYNDTRLSYSQYFNRVHHISAHVGIRYNHNQSQNEYGYGYNTATDDFVSVGQGDPSLRSLGGGIGEWNWMNAYLNANYAFRNKYFFSFNLALDGSSRFGKQVEDGLFIGDNVFAVMPSVAAGWLISSENFLSHLNGLDLLKLRASYSKVGNYDIGNYAARQYLKSQNLLGVHGLVRGNIGNPKLKWEDVNKVNLGLDAAVLNERLRFSFDFFKNKTSDMLAVKMITEASGFKYVNRNMGAMETSGIEAMMNGRIINNVFKWDLGVNIATYNNKVTALPNGQELTSYAGATYLTKEGGVANLFYGYQTTNQSTNGTALKYINEKGNLVSFQEGDVHFKDINEDGLINAEDRTVIGNPNPDFTGGVNTTFSWKQWSLSALFTFSYGNDIYNYSRAQLEAMSGTDNQLKSVVNRWRMTGQTTGMPRVAWNDPSGNARFSDRWIEDGSYLRLKYLSLSYDVPVHNDILRYIKIYASADNLFTWTKYLGYDPEFSASRSLFTQGIDLFSEPQYRTFQLGVRLGF